MNILLASRVFYPSVGGMETVAMQLAEAWIDQGHTVQIVTQTPLGKASKINKLCLHRNPSLLKWKKLLTNVDVFVQSGISLKSLPLGLLARKPIVFIHHGMLPVSLDSVGARILLKRWATYLGYSVAVSRAVANDIPSPNKTVIHNPFRPDFKIKKQITNNEFNLLFVGRLVSEKGVDIALRALARLPSKFTLTVCGDGPEKDELTRLSRALDIKDRVYFKGWVKDIELTDIAQKMAIQLVPSRNESFGIAALEAIAYDCVVVASNTGGLPEAVGSCGILVPPEDPRALAEGVRQAVDQRLNLMNYKEEHLKKFQIETIANRYLNVFKNAVDKNL